MIQSSHATLVFQSYRARMSTSRNTHKTISAHASRDIARYASRNVKMILQCSPLQGSPSHHLDIASQEKHPLNSANISRSINCGTPCELHTMSSKSEKMQPARGPPLFPPPIGGRPGTSVSTSDHPARVQTDTEIHNTCNIITFPRAPRL